jgi:hypothetical protein
MEEIMDEPEQDGEFKVRDRRRFTTEGQTKEETEGAEEVAPDETDAQEPTEPRQQQASSENKAEEGPLPPLDFVTFVYSLGSQALLQLGLMNAAGSDAKRDVQAARRTMDLLALIQEKTRGNLTDDEQKAIKDLWFQVVSMIANHAFVLLGIGGTPDAQPKKDLAGAREVIDFASSLEEKAGKNLTDQEQKVIKETLFQLKMAFVEASK